ncbi:hypothetical protein [Chitinasiproducens palmae]|uniref:3-deoxy-D-arabino-heptulosonate 7-phosphate synthase n=1 Tax=Chitinasiproducens palmae TaxID=1770053 RepID=A0A1H2PUC0_9BURK|nr:hypothetical protein [Chitinasiproducens palmae]SDV50773.1 hypothetical protein SAMN05216551_11394 [Chitinasiproducens palmae]
MRSSHSDLLEHLLRQIPRRYRVPAIPVADSVPGDRKGVASVLATAIEAARIVGTAAPTGQQTYDRTLARAFTHALASLIGDAMREDTGDPAYQALVLRHRLPTVNEFAALATSAESDRRTVHAIVDAFAHPARRVRLESPVQRDALAAIHALAATAAWRALADRARAALQDGALAGDARTVRGLDRLGGEPALTRLRRLAILADDPAVRQYLALRDRSGPRAGSADALAAGSAAQHRGAAVEAAVAAALVCLAGQLNAREPQWSYRIVTSLRVPSSVPGNAQRAKSEWDAVLLRRASAAPTDAAWTLCLLAEAKTSLDAATTDLPKLLRGLERLARADPAAVYTFATQQGAVRLCGASLQALPIAADHLDNHVLYCCEAASESTPRVLSAASRMQLLCAPASLAYASRLSNGGPGAPDMLAPVWADVVRSDRWDAVRRQYATLHRVRELMVHVADLRATVERLASKR